MKFNFTDYIVSQAKLKDKTAAKQLLKIAVENFKNEKPLHKDLNLYLIECFEAILNDEPAGKALNLIGYQKNTNYNRDFLIAEEFCLTLEELMKKDNSTKETGYLRKVADMLLEEYQKDPVSYPDYPTSDERIIQIFKKYKDEALSKIECDQENRAENY